MRFLIPVTLLLFISGCEVQTLYDQEPPAAREVILGMELTIVACNSHLFIPRQELGPDAICINLFTPELTEDFRVDLSASSIALNGDPPQDLLELMPLNDKPANSQFLSGDIRRDHLAQYSIARDGIPRVIILFPADAVQDIGGRFEVTPMGTSQVNLDLLFRSGEQQHRDIRSFTITDRNELYTILDL